MIDSCLGMSIWPVYAHGSLEAQWCPGKCSVQLVVSMAIRPWRRTRQPPATVQHHRNGNHNHIGIPPTERIDGRMLVLDAPTHITSEFTPDVQANNISHQPAWARPARGCLACGRVLRLALAFRLRWQCARPKGKPLHARVVIACCALSFPSRVTVAFGTKPFPRDIVSH